MPTLLELSDFLRDSFPQTKCRIEEAAPRAARVSHPIGFAELRPGGTVSGPVMMALADVALYVAVLATIGIVPLAVTTQLSINFMNRPAADRELIGDATLLKVGRSLVVGEVRIRSRGNEVLVAHAVGTYSIPNVGS